MVYNELEQEDILSEVRVGLPPRAYTDILLRSIWAIFKIRQSPGQYCRFSLPHWHFCTNMTIETPFFLPYDRQNFRFRKLAEMYQR